MNCSITTKKKRKRLLGNIGDHQGRLHHTSSVEARCNDDLVREYQKRKRRDYTVSGRIVGKGLELDCLCKYITEEARCCMDLITINLNQRHKCLFVVSRKHKPKFISRIFFF